MQSKRFMGKPFVFENVTEEELSRLAHVISPLARRGDFITLKGPLGAGKSVFARSFVRTAMGNEALDVPSPTYTLVQHYVPRPPYPEILHADLYRVESPEELREIGLDDAADAIVILEWPERLSSPAPGEVLGIKISPNTNSDLRTVSLSPGRGWAKRLANLKFIRA